MRPIEGARAMTWERFDEERELRMARYRARVLAWETVRPIELPTGNRGEPV